MTLISVKGKEVVISDPINEVVMSDSLGIQSMILKKGKMAFLEKELKTAGVGDGKLRQSSNTGKSEMCFAYSSKLCVIELEDGRVFGHFYHILSARLVDWGEVEIEEDGTWILQL